MIIPPPKNDMNQLYTMTNQVTSAKLTLKCHSEINEALACKLWYNLNCNLCGVRVKGMDAFSMNTLVHLDLLS